MRTELATNETSGISNSNVKYRWRFKRIPLVDLGEDVKITADIQGEQVSPE